MGLEGHWPVLDAAEIEDLARSWLRELDAPSGDDAVEQSVVMMGFMAPAEQQWAFIVTAVSLAKTDEQMGHIAAGPVECLLSRHGHECVQLFEDKARGDRVFARMLTGVWKHLMSDDIWKRVQALQAEVDEPLRNSDEAST
jgi:hypothetical protein